MLSRGISADQASATWQRCSQDLNTKLDNVARAIIEHRGQIPPRRHR